MAVQPGSLLVFRDEAYTSSLHGIMEVIRAGACKAASCWGRCSVVLSAGLMRLRLLTHGCQALPHCSTPSGSRQLETCELLRLNMCWAQYCRWTRTCWMTAWSTLKRLGCSLGAGSSARACACR